MSIKGSEAIDFSTTGSEFDARNRNLLFLCRVLYLPIYGDLCSMYDPGRARLNSHLHQKNYIIGIDQVPRQSFSIFFFWVSFFFFFPQQNLPFKPGNYGPIMW